MRWCRRHAQSLSPTRNKGQTSRKQGDWLFVSDPEQAGRPVDMESLVTICQPEVRFFFFILGPAGNIQVLRTAMTVRIRAWNLELAAAEVSEVRHHVSVLRFETGKATVVTGSFVLLLLHNAPPGGRTPEAADGVFEYTTVNIERNLG